MINEKIEKEGDQWVVKSEEGKTLGSHPTKEDAVEQLKAIEASKSKNEVIKKPELETSSYDPKVLDAAIKDAKQKTQDYESAFYIALHRLSSEPKYREKLQKALVKKISEREEIIGGVGDGSRVEDFDSKEVVKGIKVEFEHTNDFDKAVEIALDHLTEDPKYYSKLEKSDLSHDLEEAKSYKKYDKNMSIIDIAKAWSNKGEKLYDPELPKRYHAIKTWRKLWPFKATDRSNKKNRLSGRAKDDSGESELMDADKKWKTLIVDMIKNGWDRDKPLMIKIGKNGNICVAEGNHRLAIAKEIYSLKGKDISIPVKFLFYNKVDCGKNISQLQEMSAMGGGSVQGAPPNKSNTDKDNPWYEKNVYTLEESVNYYVDSFLVKKKLNEISDTPINFVLKKLAKQNKEFPTTPNTIFKEGQKRKLIELPAQISREIASMINFFEENDYNFNLYTGYAEREYEREIPAGPKKGEIEVKTRKNKIGTAINGVVTMFNKVISPYQEMTNKMIKGYSKRDYSSIQIVNMIFSSYGKLKTPRDLSGYPLLEKSFNQMQEMGNVYPKVKKIAENFKDTSSRGPSFFKTMSSFIKLFDPVDKKRQYDPRRIIGNIQRISNEVNNWPEAWSKKSKDYLNNPDEIYQDNDNILIASRDPIDILRMSDSEEIKNCHTEGGTYYECAVNEAINGGPVVFSVELKNLKERMKEILETGRISSIEEILNLPHLFFDPDRPEIGGELDFNIKSRLRLRKIEAIGEDGDSFTFLAPEKRVYGIQMRILYETLKDYAFEKQKDLFFEKGLQNYKNFKLLGSTYSDTFGRQILSNFFKNTELEGDWIKDIEFEFRDERSAPVEKEYILKYTKSFNKYGYIINNKLQEITKEERIKGQYEAKVREHPDFDEVFISHNLNLSISFMFKDKKEDLVQYEKGKKYLEENNLQNYLLRQVENSFLKNLGFEINHEKGPIKKASSSKYFGKIMLNYRPLQQQNSKSGAIEFEEFKGALENFLDSIKKLKEDLSEIFETMSYILNENDSDILVK